MAATSFYFICITILFFVHSQELFIYDEKYEGSEIFPISSDSDINAETCQMYTCKQKSQTFDPKTCIYFVAADNTYYVSKCTDKTYSLCNIMSSANSTCSIPPRNPTTEISWPGEKCQNASDCTQGCIACKKGICIGQPQDASCASTKECNVGLHCLIPDGAAAGSCQPQLEIGAGGCTDDYDCVNGAGCNVQVSGSSDPSNKCISYYSLQPGEIVANCFYNSNLLCSSSVCQTQVGVNYCVKSLASEDPNLPNPCEPGSTCKSASDSFFTNPFSMSSPCVCGLNANGTAYCPLFPGDSPYSKLIELEKKGMSSSDFHKCHSMRRFVNRCRELYWDKKDYNALDYYYAYVNNFPQIQGSEDCVLELFQSEYLSKRKEYNSDFAYILGISAALLILYH